MNDIRSKQNMVFGANVIIFFSESFLFLFSTLRVRLIITRIFSKAFQRPKDYSKWPSSSREMALQAFRHIYDQTESFAKNEFFVGKTLQGF